jgi:WD40 repeat protein
MWSGSVRKVYIHTYIGPEWLRLRIPVLTLTPDTGEMLASAGDDGNVLLWVPSELQTQPGLGEDRSDDKETWRVKHMCRSSGAEIYDLAWSPDGVFIITGSMDNIARIYNAQTGLFTSFH